MRTARSSAIALAVVLAIVAQSRARAQPADGEALFREGKRLFKKGDIAAACDKFEASEKLDPQIGTELDLGICREQNGQTASAWVMFLKAATAAKRAHDDREADARKRASALEDQLVYLTIDVPDDSVVDDLVVKRNDTPIERGEWAQPIPVDPGEYTITAEAPGREPWSETITVKAKNKKIEVPKLERVKREVTRERPRHTRQVEHHEPPNRHRGLAIALAGFGGGALGIATGFAIYSQNVENQADITCPMIQCSDAHAVDLNRTARLDGWIANIGWAVGGACLAGAGISWWLGSQSDDATISVVPVVGGDRAGLAVGGRF